MDRNNLKQKINKVKWWAIGFTLAYLIVGAFLVSDYPLSESIFDPRKTYDLIKDALTLTAYFLGPIAAFVLFIDWREQHVLKKIEKDIELVVQNLQNFRFEITRLLEIIRSGVLTESDYNLYKIQDDKVHALYKNIENQIETTKKIDSNLLFFLGMASLLNLKLEGYRSYFSGPIDQCRKILNDNPAALEELNIQIGAKLAERLDDFAKTQYELIELNFQSNNFKV